MTTSHDFAVEVFFGSVQVSDEAAIRGAQQAYDAQTGHEKELVGERLKAKLAAAQTALKRAQENTISEGGQQTGDETGKDIPQTGDTDSPGVRLTDRCFRQCSFGALSQAQKAKRITSMKNGARTSLCL